MKKISYEVRLPLYKLSDANYEKLKKVMIGYGLIKG
jgi:regulatory protein YycH of two-component signal transduction system YycFG